MPLSAYGGLGEPLARRSIAQAGTGRGRLPPATAGLEVTPPQADEPLERQKRHQQVHFRLLTNANWLLNRGYKNGPLIFGETPGESADSLHTLSEKRGGIEWTLIFVGYGRGAMERKGAKRNILAFMYAERLKSTLIITGQLLDALGNLKEGERAGGLKIFSSFLRGVTGEMRVAANVMESLHWESLSRQLNLMEGYVRLGHMEAARQELSHTLSRLTTLSGRAMTYLKEADLL